MYNLLCIHMHLCYSISTARLFALLDMNPHVAKRQRDASCLSVVIASVVQIVEQSILLLVT